MVNLQKEKIERLKDIFEIEDKLLNIKCCFCGKSLRERDLISMESWQGKHLCVACARENNNIIQ